MLFKLLNIFLCKYYFNILILEYTIKFINYLKNKIIFYHKYYEKILMKLIK